MKGEFVPPPPCLSRKCSCPICKRKRRTIHDLDDALDKNLLKQRELKEEETRLLNERYRLLKYVDR